MRLAAVLVGLSAALGLSLLGLAARLMDSDPGFLFAILPILITGLLVVGLFLAMAAVALAVRLLRCAAGARLQTTLAGSAIAGWGLFLLMDRTRLAVFLLLYGGMLVALMMTTGAKAELAGFSSGLTAPAPWGSTPGSGVWSREPAQQGPWSPDPTTVPWLRRPTSGPRTPWWTTWQAGLVQGIPLWEALLLGCALLAWGSGLVLFVMGLGQQRMGPLPVALLASGIGLTWFLERRMRQRLSGQSPGVPRV